MQLVSVPEIIGGTPKIWAVSGYAHAPFSPKFLMGFYFQRMWSQSTNVTDGQTDGRHAIPRPRICTKVHCAVKMKINERKMLSRGYQLLPSQTVQESKISCQPQPCSSHEWSRGHQAIRATMKAQARQSVIESSTGNPDAKSAAMTDDVLGGSQGCSDGGI